MRKVLVYAALAGLLVYAFDHMMRADKAQLCSNDATACGGCT